jgi:hypothetical protein
MRDTDPEDEVGDIDRPQGRLTIAGDAQALVNLPRPEGAADHDKEGAESHP